MLDSHATPSDASLASCEAGRHRSAATDQQAFIEALAETGSVRLASEAVGMSPTAAYALLHAPSGDAFAHAWDAAVELAARRVRDLLIDHALNGVPEDVWHRGRRVGRRRRFDHRLMMWVLQQHFPGEYGRSPRAARREEHPKDWCGVPVPTPEEAAAQEERDIAKVEAMLDKARARFSNPEAKGRGT